MDVPSSGPSTGAGRPATDPSAVAVFPADGLVIAVCPADNFPVAAVVPAGNSPTAAVFPAGSSATAVLPTDGRDEAEVPAPISTSKTSADSSFKRSSLINFSNRARHSAWCLLGCSSELWHPGVMPCFSCCPTVMYTPFFTPGVPGTGVPGLVTPERIASGVGVGGPRGCQGRPTQLWKPFRFHLNLSGFLQIVRHRLMPCSVATKCSSDCKLLPNQMPVFVCASSFPFSASATL